MRVEVNAGDPLATGADLVAAAGTRAAELGAPERALADADPVALVYTAAAPLAVLALEPENVRALASLAKCHLDLGDLATATRLLEAVPQDKQADPAVAGVRAALDLAEQAASLGDLADLQRKVEANPADHQARFDLALGLAARGDREAATDHLVEIIKRDRTWNEDGARKQLLQFFEAWGPMDEMTVAGRRKLSTVLFR